MNIQIVETCNLKDFSLDGVHSTPLLDDDKVRALLLNLEAGQAVTPCQMSVPVMYYVIEGQGHLHMGDGQAGLQTGSLVIVPAKAVRSIAADERMHVLTVQV
jgi:quercetin dioxygenase-like cupin family protein